LEVNRYDNPFIGCAERRLPFIKGEGKEMEQSREEHLKWCKQRAMEYVNAGDWQQGITSMLSDLGKHSETQSSVQIGSMIMLTVRDRASAKRFVEGFN
jgi:hypothetical protein